ncbi:MAG: TRAM domain-containing protein, partial [Microthrixaceae bacterium]
MTDPDTPAVAAVGDTVEVVLERPVAGGVCLAHEDAGRVVLVEGGLPGETVQVQLGESRPR